MSEQANSTIDDSGSSKKMGKQCGRHPLKATDAVRQEFSVRIEKLAGAIHSYGVQRLYDALVEKGSISENFNFQTFQTDFKRMKSKKHTGFVTQPELLGCIFDVISYPASGLFGGPKTDEDKMRKVVAEGIAEYSNEEKQKKHKVHMTNLTVINHARSVGAIVNGILYPPPFCKYMSAAFLQLYAFYSSKDKTWNHETDKTIKKLLSLVFYGSRNVEYSFYTQELYWWPGSKFREDPLDKGGVIDGYWNNCLAVAYQLHTIDDLYRLHHRQKKVRIPKEKNEPKFLIPKFVHSSQIQYIDVPVDGENSMKSMIQKFRASFEAMIDDFAINTHKISQKNGGKLYVIINKLQEFLSFLLSPELQYDDILPVSGEITLDDFKNRVPIVERKYVLSVTKEKMDILQECIDALDEVSGVVPVDTTKPAVMHAKSDKETEDELYDALMALIEDPGNSDDLRDVAKNISPRKYKIVKTLPPQEFKYPYIKH